MFRSLSLSLSELIILNQKKKTKNPIFFKQASSIGLVFGMQYDSFYTQHKLSPASYVQKAMRAMRINYLSSAEIGFLKTMNGKVTAKTKLIFQALGADEIEPTTNKKYSELLQDLASIKAFATGILVPKEYIWPVQADQYLGAPSTLVSDAHKQGLEVYASGFANDFFASYNYSYDPTSEYLQFVDNSKFSVDGVLTDFSPTASEAIGEITHCHAFTIFLL